MKSFSSTKIPFAIDLAKCFPTNRDNFWHPYEQSLMHEKTNITIGLGIGLGN